MKAINIQVETINNWLNRFDGKSRIEAEVILNGESIDLTSNIISESRIWDYIEMIFKDEIGDLDVYPFHLIDWDSIFQDFLDNQFIEFEFNRETWYVER